MRALLLALLLVGCTKATPTDTPAPQHGDKAGYAPPTPAPKPKATIELSAVTFGDDCGGTVPTTPPAHVAPSEAAAPATTAAPSVVAERRRPGNAPAQEPLNRRCEQTSMQLVIVANADADIDVKSVDVIDDAGKDQGMLATSKPTRWSTTSSTYEAWNEKVAAGETAQVSYVLSQPPFVARYGYTNKTYTVKVVASVGGVEQALQTTVLVVALPPPVPT